MNLVFHISEDGSEIEFKEINDPELTEIYVPPLYRSSTTPRLSD